MSHSPSRLPRKIQNALSLVDGVVLAYDRLHFWLDHPLPAIPSALHEDDRVKVIARSMQYHPVWQTKIELLQPDVELLAACSGMIGSRYRTELSKAEIKLDLLTRTRSDAKHLQAIFLEHLLIESSSYPVKIEKGTAYFKPPTNAHGNPSPFNFVVYSDNPNKETGRPCCHLEWRVSGAAALENIGLITLENCTGFNHRDFWSKRLHLFTCPSKAAIGRWLQPDNADVSPTMLTNRADKFLKPHLHNSTLILQNCFVENPDLIELLTPVNNALFLPE